MNSLDNKEEIKKIDKDDLIDSIYNLADQVTQAWEEVGRLTFTQDFSEVNNIVVAGMGGSALGARVIDSLLLERIRVPLEITTDFRLPNYVNSKTLVILSSYSGNTEETLSCYYDADKKHAKIFGITTGGKLENLLTKDKKDAYIFKPYNNPSAQPRMSLGYGITSILALLSRFAFANVTEDEIVELASFLKGFTREFGVENSESGNLAKSFAKKLKDKAVILVSGEHLLGVAHAFKNQLNENAKTFSALFDLPELNHHLLEGLTNPGMLKDYSDFVIFTSELYSDQLKKVVKATSEIVSMNGFNMHFIPARGNTKLQQIFEILVFGSFASYYLALLYGIDPTPINWVDLFKKKLKS